VSAVVASAPGAVLPGSSGAGPAVGWHQGIRRSWGSPACRPSCGPGYRSSWPRLGSCAARAPRSRASTWSRPASKLSKTSSAMPANS